MSDRRELEKELRLAVQFLGRKLSAYMSRKGKAEAERKRANLYSKYMPLIAQFCAELAGRKDAPDVERILKGMPSGQAQA